MSDLVCNDLKARETLFNTAVSLIAACSFVLA